MSYDEMVPLTDELAQSLIKAANKDSLTRRTPQEKLLLQLHERYPFRIRRIVKDLRWLEKKARRNGITFQ